MNKVSLFYWSSKLYEDKSQENYGDILSRYIVERLSGAPVVFFNALKQRKSLFKKKYLMAIGSILAHAQNKAHIWGSGIITREDQIAGATFYAVRGPLSRKRILELGHHCPAVYGDPAILWPLYYNPAVNKKYKIGIIPHYVDFKEAQTVYDKDDRATVIDLLNDDVFYVTDRIVECENIISSSLHGVIVAHAYGIPALWVPFSNKLSGDNVKFEDYFRSVEIEPYSLQPLGYNKTYEELCNMLTAAPLLPQEEVLNGLRTNLIAAFPQEFKAV